MTLTEGAGFIARKLLGEIGSEAIIMSMAASPSPSTLDRAHLSSSSACDDTSHIQSSHANIILALLALLLFATFLSAHLQRCYLHHNNPGHATIMPYYQPPPIPLSPPHGLDSAILKTLPKVVFSVAVAERTQTECMICLEEFENEQTLQVLPQCGHGFHPECIHMWLFSHTTCPLCRHSLLLPLKPSASSTVEAAVCDSVGGGSSSRGGLTLTPQHPSTPLQVQNFVATTCISIRGESKPSLDQMKPASLRRSHSTGHFLIKEEEEATYSASSSSLHSFVMSDFHRCSSDSIIMSETLTT